MKERTRKSGASNESSRAPERFRSLLVPVDLTPSADRVVGRIALLPLAEAARVTLLHVVPGSLSPREQRRTEQDARKALAYEMRHLRRSLSVQVEALVKFGGAADRIAAHADVMKAELIVMGRGGGRGLRDVFLGSTAERVIRQAKLPVLVVRSRPRAAYSRPALALDFDRAAYDVLGPMLRIIQSPRPRVAIIHAFGDPYDGFRFSSLSEHEAEERLTRRRIQVSAELARLLARLLRRAKLRPDDAPVWESHIRHGSPRVVIRKTVEKVEPDLLVLGTRASSAAGRVFVGTIAGDALRAVTCDVLVVPPSSPKRTRAATSDRPVRQPQG
jgi:nucleotide-binding universal stress UspA family protein